MLFKGQMYNRKYPEGYNADQGAIVKSKMLKVGSHELKKENVEDSSAVTAGLVSVEKKQLKVDMNSKGDVGPKEQHNSKGDIGPKRDERPKDDAGPLGGMGPKGDTEPKGEVEPIGETGPMGDVSLKADVELKGDIELNEDTVPKGETGPQGEIFHKISFIAWEKFITHLLHLDIHTVDFATTTQPPQYDKSPLYSVKDSMVEIEDYIIPLWHLIGLKFTVPSDDILEAQLLEGLLRSSEESSQCEYFLRKRLELLQEADTVINIATLGDRYYFNIQNVKVIGVGVGIVLVKPATMSKNQDCFALSICKISSIEKCSENICKREN